MLVSYFQSLRYVGHLVPLVLVRFYLGYYYLTEGLRRWESGFLVQPKLAESLRTGLLGEYIPEWYEHFLRHTVLPNWKGLAVIVVIANIAIGVSFLFGLLVRPMALMAAYLSLNYALIMRGNSQQYFELLFIINLVFALVGAGRCLGFDYFFYKKYRSIWW